MDAFDAATHCASLTAAERLACQQQQQQQEQQQATRQQQQGVTAEFLLQVAAQHDRPAGGSGMQADLVDAFLA